MEEEIVIPENFDDDGYNIELLEEVKRLAMLGISEEDMAFALGITYGKFQTWKKNEHFARYLHDGKTHADAKVAEAFYKRAIGYEYDEVWEGEEKGMPFIKRMKKHMPPDPWTCARWLTVKRRNDWSEIQRTEIINTNINVARLDLSGISDEELMLLKSIQQKQLGNAAG